jgi:hypothetical protein
MENISIGLSRLSQSLRRRTQTPAEAVQASVPRTAGFFGRCCNGLLRLTRTQATVQTAMAPRTSVVTVTTTREESSSLTIHTSGSEPDQNLTLEVVLGNTELMAKFIDFAHTEMSSENLEFLVRCNKFMAGEDVLGEIIELHVDSETTNISSDTRSALLAQKGAGPLNIEDPAWRTLLEAAHREVARLVRQGPLNRFNLSLAKGEAPMRIALNRRLSQAQINAWNESLTRRGSTASTASDATTASASLLEQKRGSEHAVGPEEAADHPERSPLSPA